MGRETDDDLDLGDLEDGDGDLESEGEDEAGVW